MHAAIQFEGLRNAGNPVPGVVAALLANCKAPAEIYSPVTLCLIGVTGLFGRGTARATWPGNGRGTRRGIRLPIQFDRIMF